MTLFEFLESYWWLISFMLIVVIPLVVMTARFMQRMIDKDRELEEKITRHIAHDEKFEEEIKEDISEIKTNENNIRTQMARMDTKLDFIIDHFKNKK